MKVPIDSLKALCLAFDRAAKDNFLSPETIKRYQSWIRRYLIFCRSVGVQVNLNTATAFLQTYPLYSTRRQGYFAIKFLFEQVMRNQKFVTLDACAPYSPPRSHRWRHWWRRFKARSFQ